MKKIKPPQIDSMVYNTIMTKHPELFEDYMVWNSPVDPNNRYRHYDKLRFIFDKKLDHELAWTLVKYARNKLRSEVITLGEPAMSAGFVLTSHIQRAISETDRNTTTAALDWVARQLNEKEKLNFLLEDLGEDESISSSQLEGAATTTSVAKEMLKTQREPKTKDEKMVLGNYKLMLKAWEYRKDDLSIDLIKKLHIIGVEGIDDDEYKPGEFRKEEDDVYVENRDSGDRLHTPPPADTLEQRLEAIVKWANDNHCNNNSPDYLHPLVKAIILHFIVGFEHPFIDGNGRVARALFYWFMFKHGFVAFRFIAISLLLKKAPASYARSYLRTETDDLDLTYFIEYQCSIILRAIKRYTDTYTKAAQDIADFNAWLFKSGLWSKLSERQRTVFQVANSGIANRFSIDASARNLGCSYNTASKELKGLVKLGLFKQSKEGKNLIFSALTRETILKNWQ